MNILLDHKDEGITFKQLFNEVVEYTVSEAYNGPNVAPARYIEDIRSLYTNVIRSFIRKGFIKDDFDENLSSTWLFREMENELNLPASTNH